MYKTGEVNVGDVVKRASWGVLIAILLPMIIGSAMNIDFIGQCKYVSTDNVGQVCGSATITTTYTNIDNEQFNRTPKFGEIIVFTNTTAVVDIKDSPAAKPTFIHIDSVFFALDDVAKRLDVFELFADKSGDGPQAPKAFSVLKNEENANNVFELLDNRDKTNEDEIPAYVYELDKERINGVIIFTYGISGFFLLISAMVAVLTIFKYSLKS